MVSRRREQHPSTSRLVLDDERLVGDAQVGFSASSVLVERQERELVNKNYATYPHPRLTQHSTLRGMVK